MISLLHDQWLILKQVLLQCHMHNSGHEESDQSLLPAFTTFLLELGFPFCAIDQPCNSGTVLGCRQPRVSKGHNNKRTSPRESSNQEKKISTAAAATLCTFSNSVSNLLMMMMMIFSTSVVQNLAGNNRYSCQPFSSSVCSSDADPQEAFPIEKKKRRSDEEKVERFSNNSRLQIECRRRWGSLLLLLLRLSYWSSSSSAFFVFFFLFFGILERQKHLEP